MSMTSEVTCPSCGTQTHLYDVGRDATAFCRTCDYPLFWTRGALLGAVAAGDATGLRRLPGTAGRVAVAEVPCPACDEHNPVTRTHCIRCGADLFPAPPVEPEPEPEPVTVPEPVVAVEEPASPSWWPWVAFVLATLTAIAVIVTVLAAAGPD